MYKIGLDIGTTSVGFAVLSVDGGGEADRIIRLGTRIFDAAENTKDGSSLAAPRREARGIRRRSRRQIHRKDRIKGLLQGADIISRQELSEIYEKGGLSDIYEIRCGALDRVLTREEFARLLVHYAQRRGFKSNRKNEAKDTDGGKLLKATLENQQYMAKNAYRTVGEMLFKDDRFKDVKRNKGGDYSNTFLRSQIVDEVKSVFKAQRKLGSQIAMEDFEEKYLNILESQRSFETGPASGPYSGDQIAKMVGKCTFERTEDRGVKASYTFEYFNLLQKINSMGIKSQAGKRFLTKQEKEQLCELAHTTEKLTFARIRKELKLSDSEYFTALTYSEKSVEEIEKAKFQYLPAYHEMRKAFDKIGKGYIKGLTVEKRDAIAKALTYYKTDEKIQGELEKSDLEKQELEAVKGIKNFSKVGNLSIKAMKRITPYLEQGMVYSDACTAAGYLFTAHKDTKGRYLPRLPKDTYEITSPVVKRAINQTIKVLNEIIKEYGKPIGVNIELAREMSKNFDERKKIEKSQKENETSNQKLYDEIKEMGVSKPSGQDIVKYKLWNEQKGICLYTNTPLKVERLFEPGYCEVDHIIPYSISFDDSYKNKALVTTQANREKGNRLPMEYVKSKDDFIGIVRTLITDKYKRDKLLKLAITTEDESEMKERSLQDTKFIASFMQNYIKDNLEFDDTLGKKKYVTAVNGSVTSYMRKRWGINKLRENGDLHHAIDAVVVACIGDGIIQKVTRFSKYNENEFVQSEENQEFFPSKHFPLPWKEFRTELDIRTCKNPSALLEEVNLPNYYGVDLATIRPPFVSRMVRNKQTGQAHKDTIRSYRKVDDEMMTVSKTALQNLKYDKEKDEIVGYYNPSSDILLYNLLKDKLRSAAGDAKKAFPEGSVIKPNPKGGLASTVKKVKIVDKSNLNVGVNGGVAANGDMVRIDIFKPENDGYYFVPIYVSDLIKKELPNKASVASKNYEDWKEMQEGDFLFSLHPNDLIKVVAKKEITFTKVFEKSDKPQTYSTKEEFVYYKKSGISGATITVINNDNSYIINSLGIKTLVSLEKYYTDVLGNIYKAGKENRK